MAIDWSKLATFKAVFSGLDVVKVSLQSFQGLNVMRVVKEGMYWVTSAGDWFQCVPYVLESWGPPAAELCILIAGRKNRTAEELLVSLDKLLYFVFSS